jgi:hypothetical protein
MNNDTCPTCKRTGCIVTSERRDGVWGEHRDCADSWHKPKSAYGIAYNESTSLYEVHAAGCRHLSLNPRLEVTLTVTAVSGDAAAKSFEGGNEGCITKLGPCAR